MALDAQGYQNLIVLEVGDDPAGTIAANVATFWAMYDYKSSVSLELQYLYAKRKAIDVLTGKVREQVTFEAAGQRFDLNKMMDNLVKMRAAVQSDIDEWQGEGVGLAPATGTLNQNAPVMAPNPPDANSREYRGDPYLPRRRIY